MKQEILDKIKKFGGNVDRVKGRSLQEDVGAITFDTVLYADFYGGFEVYKLKGFFDENKELYRSDKEMFFAKVLEKYFCMTEEGYGQKFWVGKSFTPFTEGTPDFEEWNDWFSDDEYVDLKEVQKVVGDGHLEFILLFESYGFPDHYYICLSDPNPENPTVFGTDHEVFFKEISNVGSLEDFLENFLTKEEFLDIVKEEIESYPE